MHRGWVGLYRKIQEHWLWEDKPFDKRSAWIDMILMANHKCKKIMLGNELIEVNRGTFVTSQSKLMNRWGWGKEKLRKFLKLLEQDNMIKVSTTKKYTQISIINYEIYQNQTSAKPVISNSIENKQTTSRPQADHKETINGLQSDTNKNVKNVKNEKKNNYMSDSNEYRLAEYLYKHILKNNPEAKEPNLEKWAKTFDYILRIDKRDLEEVTRLIEFCQKHHFWYKNILSADKFRKQYDRLVLDLNDTNKQQVNKASVNSSPNNNTGWNGYRKFE